MGKYHISFSFLRRNISLRMDNLNALGRPNSICSSGPTITQTCLLNLIRISSYGGTVHSLVLGVSASANGNRSALMAYECGAVAGVTVCLRAFPTPAAELVGNVGDVAGVGRGAGGLACDAVLAGVEIGGQRRSEGSGGECEGEDKGLLGVHLVWKM